VEVEKKKVSTSINDSYLKREWSLIKPLSTIPTPTILMIPVDSKV